ncbi:MAG: hypothetical protein Q9227_008283 [Pyrenula ochraceoflavens]
MASDNNSTSPPRNKPFRPGTLQSFIPLNEEPKAFTTRGQRLPALLSSRSTTSHFTPASLSQRGASLDVRDEEAGELPQDLRKRPSSITRNGSIAPEVLVTPQMRSMRLIGNSNPRYQWERYYKTDGELKQYKKPVREYYERNNYLIAQYLYIDRLLDSSLPHNLIQEYIQPVEASHENLTIPNVTGEELLTPPKDPSPSMTPCEEGFHTNVKVKRTPKNIYRVPEGECEDTPLLGSSIPDAGEDEAADSNSPVVTSAIYVNLTANLLLLIGKIAVIVLTSSLSVLASLVDAALDFLSTAIIWTTTKLISRQDQYAYPVGRRRLEPVGVLVFSVIMITSFAQVGLECLSRLSSSDHSLVSLGLPSILIMASTVVIKGLCYLYCRLIRNSSVQALAQDAMTDVVFNSFSILFPLVGFYAKQWYLDALGGLLLSLYVIFNWASTSTTHIRNLTGAAASADQRNVLLYLTMRFARTIRHIQGLQAYHAGDQLVVEADIVIDEGTSLRDSHDLGESLQYVLESVPSVDRAFVHLDYTARNLPTHMNQMEG